MSAHSSLLTGWLSRHFRSLRDQALAHLLLVAVVAALAVLVIGLGAFFAFEGRDIAQRREATHAYYAAQLVRTENAWQQGADQVKARIEFSRLLESRHGESVAKLTAFLNAQWAFLDFPNMIVVGPGGDVRYRYGPAARAVEPADIGSGDWYVLPSYDEVFRVFRLPLWLGPEGQGKLLLLRPLNVETLRQLAIPEVHLEVYLGKREVLHSHPEFDVPEVPMRHDTVLKADQRFVDVELPWPGANGTVAPRLKAYRLIGPVPFGTEFRAAAVLVSVAMTVLLWFGLGRWLGKTVRRIESVDSAVDAYATGRETVVTLAARLAPLQQVDDEIAALAGAFENLAATVELREAEQKIFMETLAQLEEAVLDLDFDGRILHASPGWARLCHHDDVVGVMLSQFVVPEDVENLQRQCQRLRSGEHQQVILRLRLAAGALHEQWVEARLIGYRDADGKISAIRGIVRDVTQTYEHERQITHMALHDALTGLPNRVLLEDRFKVALRLARRSGHRAAVCFLDLDNFKTVNDTLGHKAGDALLVKFSDMLRGALRSGDTLARWGGDEFVVLLPDMDSVDAVREVTRKIVDMMQQPIRLEGTEILVTFSMGACVYPDDGGEIEQLFSQADRAMFYAKAQGRNQVCFFGDMADKGLARRDLYIQSSLAHAISNNIIQAWFQPLISARDGRCVGAEVLARWHDTNMGWISPATFIPMAENMGLIRDLGGQAWLAGLAALHAWHAAGRVDLSLAINISKRQLFLSSLTERMLEDLERFGVAANRITLEVTESVALRDVEHATARLQELRDAGFRIAVDDFGTGYSSLSQLHEIPASELKIDMSFVQRVHDPKGLSMVQSIIQIAHTLGLQSVAEGVENEETAAILRRLGVDILQGYHFGKPMPPEEFSRWLERN